MTKIGHIKTNKELSEELQEDIICFLDGLPDDLITEICQVVVNYYSES